MARQLQELHYENARLQRLVAEQALDNQILREAARLLSLTRNSLARADGTLAELGRVLVGDKIQLSTSFAV